MKNKAADDIHVGALRSRMNLPDDDAAIVNHIPSSMHTDVLSLLRRIKADDDTDDDDDDYVEWRETAWGRLPAATSICTHWRKWPPTAFPTRRLRWQRRIATTTSTVKTSHRQTERSYTWTGLSYCPHFAVKYWAPYTTRYPPGHIDDDCSCRILYVLAGHIGRHQYHSEKLRTLPPDGTLTAWKIANPTDPGGLLFPSSVLYVESKRMTTPMTTTMTMSSDVRPREGGYQQRRLYAHTGGNGHRRHSRLEDWDDRDESRLPPVPWKHHIDRQSDPIHGQGYRTALTLRWSTEHPTRHATHQGISMMTARAESSMFWLGISADISTTQKNCEHCHRMAPSQPGRSPIPPILVVYFFQVVCSDFFVHRGIHYLVTVDRYSNCHISRQVTPPISSTTYVARSWRTGRQKSLHQTRTWGSPIPRPGRTCTDGVYTTAYHRWASLTATVVQRLEWRRWNDWTLT